MKPNEFNHTDQDVLLMSLMAKMPLEKAPDNFTHGIMQQLQPGLQTVSDTHEYRRQMLWGYLTVAAAFAGVILMIFARLPFLNIDFMPDTDFIRNLLNTSLGILEGVNKVVAFFKHSSTIIIILSSIGLLLLMERLLRRGFQQNRSFLF